MLTNERVKLEVAATANERAQKLETDNLQLRTDLEAATAESRAKQAELTSEQAKLSAEQRKTAEAQREAAEAQLALKKHLEEVAGRQKPRHLTVEQRARLLSFLRNQPIGAIKIGFNFNNPEARDFASEIAVVLKEAGWNVTDFEPTIEATVQKGLAIFVQNDRTARAAALQRALGEIRIVAEGRMNPEIVDKDSVFLYVGPKP